MDNSLEQWDAKAASVSNTIKTISNVNTPKRHVKRRPDGLDYIEEGYMRYLLNKHFPIWSWTNGKFELLGGEWILIGATLIVQMEGVTRSFWSTGAARIQFKKDQPHTAENVVDVDKNIASANTNAFKRAINRLCNIGDDVYHKQISEPLNDMQREELKSLAKEVNKLDDLLNSLENNEIDSTNFNKMINRLKGMKK